MTAFALLSCLVTFVEEFWMLLKEINTAFKQAAHLSMSCSTLQLLEHPELLGEDTLIEHLQGLKRMQHHYPSSNSTKLFTQVLNQVNTPLEYLQQPSTPSGDPTEHSAPVTLKPTTFISVIPPLVAQACPTAKQISTTTPIEPTHLPQLLLDEPIKTPPIGGHSSSAASRTATTESPPSLIPPPDDNKEMEGAHNVSDTTTLPIEANRGAAVSFPDPFEPNKLPEVPILSFTQSPVE